MKRLTWPIIVSLSVLLPAGCSDEQSAGDIAGEMANRLTDGLSFENGTRRDAPPPAEHAGDAGYPQITSVVGPSTLVPGESFNLDLSTDFADPARIAGAVVHIDGAAQYWEVAEAYDDGLGVVRLVGTLSEGTDLGDRIFQAGVALLDTNGDVGNYGRWALQVAGTGEPQASIQGTWLMTECTCDGAPKDMGTAPLYVTYHEEDGYVEIDIDGCLMTLYFAATYPRDGAIDWTMTATVCEPEDCLPDACTQGELVRHSATYLIADNRMTLTEDPTPPEEFGCPSARQVCQLERQGE